MGSREMGDEFVEGRAWSSSSTLMAKRCCLAQIILSQVEGLTTGHSKVSVDFVVHQKLTQSGKGTHTIEAIIFFSKTLKNL